MKSQSRIITLWILDYNFAEKSHVKWPSSRTNNQSQQRFDRFFLFSQECRCYIFLTGGHYHSKVTTKSTVRISVKLDLKYIFSEASLVIKTPLYDSSIFQREEIIVTRLFQHMQSTCVLWVHTCIFSEGQKNSQNLQKIPPTWGWAHGWARNGGDGEQNSGVPLRKQRLQGEAQLHHTTPVSQYISSFSSVFRW